MSFFESAYAEGRPPWDIDGPQPAFVDLESRGLVRGRVLDAGCGTGENALFFASRGHDVTGVDYAPTAVERAQQKAEERGLDARFIVGDATKLDALGLAFDTVTDAGLYHSLDLPDALRYVAGVHAVLRQGGLFHLLTFSDREPEWGGPRRVRLREFDETFGEGWTVREVRRSKFETLLAHGAAQAWLATVVRE